MKRIEAEVAADDLEGVVERLRLIGVSGMTAVPCSRSRPPAPAGRWGRVYRGAFVEIALADAMRIDLVVPDVMAESVVRAVVAVVRRGDGADATVSVTPVDDALCIGTGRLGVDAL